MNNIKNAWKGIKDIINIKASLHKTPTQLNLNENIITDHATVSNISNIYFVSIREKVLNKIMPSKRTYSDFLNLPKANSFFIDPLSEDESNYITAPVLYVWEVESDKIQSFNFMSGESNYELLDDLLATQQQLTDAIKGYVPKSVFWDSIEPKLLVCETVRMSSINQEETSIEKDLYDNNSLIVTMFSCPKYGLVVQDHFKIDPSYTGLLGIDTPFCYFIQSGHHRDQCVARKTMRDFVEFENGDLVTKAAMMSYSYLSAIGNMDEAFKAIKSIKIYFFIYADIFF
ncbi:intraflagellar transport protein 140 homolog [Hydra vulgaris]|uniref:Intraflagellar transport protein 140 homolog n=1 Tax=Hydra vulgaris TaxID=6087 RepID=A0ABM4CB57_HYDVU